MAPGVSNPAAMVACTPCRGVKMKCIREPDSTVCSRCKRKSIPCFFEAHRRGRKAGTRLRPRAKQNQRKNSKDPLEPNLPTSSAPPTEKYVAVDGASIERARPSSMASDSLSPYGLLPRSATSGKFSIANVLNAEDEPPTPHATERRTDSPTNGGYANDMNDPVIRNLVDLQTAQKLFDNFFTYMNPFICQFDPKLHTLKYIRERSSFLFSSVLSAAAKIFMPPLYMKLRDHVETILKEILITGQMSTEIVQGICLLTYWKDPSDSRAWLLVGYAIRASIDMGWHKLHSPCRDGSATSARESVQTELDIRELRSKERTWLMLFVYDRSVSLQMGKPWMIQVDPLIRNAGNWHQHIYAVPGCDQIMSAFVQLRILGSDILELFGIDPVTTTAESVAKGEVILKLFNGDLDRWEAKWYKIVEDVSTNVAHRFIIRFYGTHLRLLLHSLGLQLSILSGNISKQALWVCYTSSLEMLHLVVDRLGVTAHSSYCQDSVHVMVAYAAVVMIKILLSLPGELPSESENMILDLISETSRHFSMQQATNTSSYHQSRFLANIVVKYRKAKEEICSSANQWLRQQQKMLEKSEKGAVRLPLLPQPLRRGSTSLQLNSSRPMITSTSPSTVSENVQVYPRHLQELNQSSFNQNDAQPPRLQTRQARTLHPQPGSLICQTTNAIAPKPANNNVFKTLAQNKLETFIAADGPSTTVPLFTDDIVWEDMFAHAGFNISSGSFVPKLAEKWEMGR
ncbi:hypothetical protein ACO22_03163 [Paracoccidioides brasiliensis]|uniref:Zn(2)-C6 fungal-type domain-containing protein n=1 Tax=Paracoccidioides brasiliensis TaxID=121759 RepID=A0A1D2JGM3_PARBR|nr:hypothetical protein ACO22_03163 [Paracoccidioides brasiliensis]